MDFLHVEHIKCAKFPPGFVSNSWENPGENINFQTNFMKKKKKEIEPFLKYDSNLESESISEYAAFVYAIIAMHADNNTREAYPSYRRICEMTGYDSKTVLEAIHTLEEKGFFTIKKVPAAGGYVRNIYCLPNLDKDFIMMSHKFIEAEEIPKDLKAFLIKLHPKLDTRIEGDRAKLTMSISDLCAYFGYRPRTIKEKLKRLIKLGIIEFEGFTTSRKLYNSQINIFIFNLPKMHQSLLKLKERVYKVESKVDEHEERIKMLEEELAFVKRKNRYLENERRMNEKTEGCDLSLCN